MKFIIGIGNPEKKYDKTRHNIGFEIVDGLNEGKWSKKNKLQAIVASLSEGIYLAKPQTYVNLTGKAVAAIAREFKLSPSDFLIVCDDVNLDFGKLRLRESGGAGGHHGLESVIEATGTMDFPRLRFGVRNADMPQDLTDFVLGPFSKDEQKRLKQLVENACEVCKTWAKSGFNQAQDYLGKVLNYKEK